MPFLLYDGEHAYCIEEYVLGHFRGLMQMRLHACIPQKCTNVDRHPQVKSN